MSRSNVPDARFFAFVFLCGLAASSYYYAKLWVLDGSGFSDVSDRLPYWDFTNLWAGGYLARLGQVQSLFGAESYREAIRALLHPDLPDQEWSYPPSLLILGVPLSNLPISLAYTFWTIGTLTGLWLALKNFRLPPSLVLCIVLSPAAFMNALFGHNGALTAALMLGGLLLVPTRPILGGILIGLLTIKPHLGILLPFCLLAGGYWRAILSATATTIVLVALTGVLFGFEVWPLFLTETRSLMTTIMEAPFMQPYHVNAVTGFALVRSLGADLATAYLAQAALTLFALVVAVWLWRSPNVEHRSRVVATGVLAMAATPYGYTYDLIPANVAVIWLLHSRADVPRLALAFFWLFPLLVHWVAFKDYNLGIIPIVALGILAARHAHQTSRDLEA